MAPFILTAEMNPPSNDEQDFNLWYNEEHVPMVSKMPGYLRCQRYQAVLQEKLSTTPNRVSKYLTIHEVEDLAGFTSPEALASGDTEWTKEHMSKVEDFVMRGWKLI